MIDASREVHDPNDMCTMYMHCAFIFHNQKCAVILLEKNPRANNYTTVDYLQKAETQT